MSGDRTEIEAIKAACPIEHVAARYTELRRAGREYVGLSPFKAERTPSFYVDPHKGTWFCFASQQGGDAISLVALADGVSVGEAIRRLKGEAGIADDPARAEARRRQWVEARAARERLDAASRARRQSEAERIWRDAKPGEGSLIEAYLLARGIDLDAMEACYGFRVPRSLRYAPRLAYRHDGVTAVGPAMVGLLEGREQHPGDVAAVHRTYLAPDGGGKATYGGPAKLTLGAVWGSAGYLTPPGPLAVVGEGYETTLSVVAALAKRGRQVFGISAAALGNLAGGGEGRGLPHPTIKGRWLPSEVPSRDRPGLLLPDFVKRVVILADNDGADPLSMQAMIARAAAKFRGQGIAVTVAWPPAGCDFNDVLGLGALSASGGRLPERQSPRATRGGAP